MADCGLKNEKVIACAFDGTGFGEDGTIWGGEFLLSDYQGFQRVGYLRPVPLIGAEKAIRQPWRLAVFWLEDVFGKDIWQKKMALFKKIRHRDWQLLRRLPKANFNSPLTSSAGRLFDAVASIILGQPEADYEASLAIELERLANGFCEKSQGYPFDFIFKDGCFIIDSGPIFRNIVKDLEQNLDRRKIAYSFHLSVAKMIQRGCLFLSKKTGIKKIVLSGGVFQNRLLTKMVKDLLSKQRLSLLLSQRVSCNDSGISLGQVVIAGIKGRA